MKVILNYPINESISLKLDDISINIYPVKTLNGLKSAK